MIEFRHSGTAVRLPAGESYAAPAGGSYRDTPENELRAVIREVESGVPWRAAVRAHYGEKSPWLTRIVTDPSRDLFIRLHPPPSGARILDVGAGWGQLTLPLAVKHQVTALEPTPERLSFIRAASAQEGVADRIHFVQADLLDLEFGTKFDLALCIGVLEWVPKFRPGEPRLVQVDFLKRIGESLTPGGTLVLGIENRIGLKYLLGARDDHLGVPGVAVLDYAEADRRWRAFKGEPMRSLTHTRVELARMLEAAGFAVAEFYAAYPDYKLPQIVLRAGRDVDDFFESGNFVTEHDGIDGSTLPFQAELHSHYRSLAALAIATEFAPSYFVVAHASQGQLNTLQP